MASRTINNNKNIRKLVFRLKKNKNNIMISDNNSRFKSIKIHEKFFKKNLKIVMKNKKIIIFIKLYFE